MGGHTYKYTDTKISDLGALDIYYRLKQVDIDGKFLYTNTVVLRVKSNMELTLYPNPVVNEATISISSVKAETIQVKLVDNAGRIIRVASHKLNVGNNSILLPVSGLASGVYHVQLTGQSFSEKRSFIKN